MKIVITSQGKDLESQVDARFGRSNGFIIYDEESSDYSYIDNNQNLQAMQGAGIPQDTSLYPYADIGGGPVIPNAQPMGFPNFNNQTMGRPPMDNPTYDSMSRDVRGTQQGPFMPNRANAQPSNKSQDWEIGKYE